MIPALSGLNISKETNGNQDATSSATSAAGSRDFKLDELPKELRLKIWQIVLLQPRIIKVEPEQLFSTSIRRSSHLLIISAWYMIYTAIGTDGHWIGFTGRLYNGHLLCCK